MQKQVLTEILHAEVSFAERPFAHPLTISSGQIVGLTEAEAHVVVRVNGVEAEGRGNIFLSDLWAWPDPSLSHAARDQALRAVCVHIAENLKRLCGKGPAHPLALGLRLHDAVCASSDDFGVPSLLARAMALSPFDAAIHDATGLALRRSAFALYPEGQPIPEADRRLGGSATAAIRALLRDPPLASLPAWWLVGRDDDLNTVVQEAVKRRGYGCFKLKLMGRESAVDVARTVEVFRALKVAGVPTIRLSVDTNEANPDAASVLDYLEQLRTADPDAFTALEYLEQPTARDFCACPQDWRAVTRLKPVLLDEGLTGLELLAEAKQQGWSGLALKTCKGHSSALVAAAWANRHGMCLSMQDLTNPGIGLMHAALFAAHVPTINGVELNSPQFAPAANAGLAERWPQLYQPVDGRHRLPSTVPDGLGSRL